MRKKFTTINEATRAALNISRDEYALLAYVQYRQADPRNKKPGWCDDPKPEIAEWVGVTERGLLKMSERLVLRGLLERERGLIRATSALFDHENERNLVPNQTELSSEKSGTKFRNERNLVPIHLSRNKVSIEGERMNSSAVGKNPDLVSDQGPQIPPQNSAAPPHSAGPKAGLDIAAEIAEMLRDFRCIERAKMQYGIESGQMGHLAGIFALKLGSEGHHPQNRRDFRNHFFNWAALEVKRLAQLSPTPRTTAAKNRATIQHFNDTEKRDILPPQKF